MHVINSFITHVVCGLLDLHISCSVQLCVSELFISF